MGFLQIIWVLRINSDPYRNKKRCPILYASSLEFDKKRFNVITIRKVADSKDKCQN
jgi:hypothetical protein